MSSRFSRIGRLMTGAAALAALAPAMTVPAAWAQQGAPTPAPTPAPRSSPSIITLPGANQFDLRPSGSQPVRATPTPAPTPERVTPSPAPVIARPRPEPAPARQPAGTATPSPRTTAAPTPAATPAATVQPSPTPAALPEPLPSVAPSPEPVPVEQSGVPWFWILAGAAIAVVLVVLGWLLGRRRRAEPEAEPVVVSPPRAAPALPPRPAPAAPPPPPAPPLAARPVAPPEAVAVELRPIAIELADTGAMLEFELTVGNATTAPMEGLRVSHGVMSANEMQDDLIASFHASQLPPVADPFDLAPRAGIRIPGRVPLTPDRINIVTVGGRPMFVPILLVDIRWRSGLSLRHQASDFMIGIGGQGEKLGPIWLDKGAQRHARLNANRYFRRPVKAAAE